MLLLPIDDTPYGAAIHVLFLNQVADIYNMHPSLLHSQGASIEKRYQSSHYNPYSSPMDTHAILGKQLLAGNDTVVLTDAHDCACPQRCSTFSATSTLRAVSSPRADRRV